MAEYTNNLYKIEKEDIKKAALVFARAFGSDPVWSKVFENATAEQWNMFFESPVRYCSMFGKLYAPSDALEGMAGWTRAEYAEMSIGRGIRCGSARAVIKAGLNNMKQMQPIFAPLEQARRDYMRGRDYIYLMILGIDPQFQGQGFGGRLIRRVLEESSLEALPVYLETSTESNVKMYEHFDFRVIGEVMHPIIDMPQWCMLREVQQEL